jgi:hypothetical protein
VVFGVLLQGIDHYMGLSVIILSFYYMCAPMLQMLGVIGILLILIYSYIEFFVETRVSYYLD